MNSFNNKQLHLYYLRKNQAYSAVTGATGLSINQQIESKSDIIRYLGFFLTLFGSGVDISWNSNL